MIEFTINRLMYATVLDTVEEAKELIGQRQVWNGREIELMRVDTHFAIVREVGSTSEWKVLWADLVRDVQWEESP